MIEDVFVGDIIVGFVLVCKCLGRVLAGIAGGPH